MFLRIGPVKLLLIFLSSFFIPGCRTSEKQRSETSTVKLPDSAALPPSTFHCEASVISSEGNQINLLVIRIIGRGSSLVYPAAPNDTIAATMNSKFVFQEGAEIEAWIEERLMLNSEKPAFILKQVKEAGRN